MMQRIQRPLLLLLFVAWGCAADRVRVPADDVPAARRLLEQQRERVRADRELAPEARARRMAALGLWQEAEALLAGAGSGADAELAAAELALRRHRYHDAAARVERVLAAEPGHRVARLLEARLEIQAWDLPAAAATLEALLAERARDADAALLLGRVRLLEKRYDEALEWARKAQRWSRSSAGAYLLEADVRFWDQDPAGAEAPLVRALELDPFDPDARFSYGYAIWRRVDATQLDAMAAQWALALEADPLHYFTHWHWGNGHTQLTYADYAHPADSVVGQRLVSVHQRIAAGDVAGAIAATREIEREFPESVLPAMTRGSAFYMAYAMEREARLDSAQATFEAILARKRNYGPAHNGMAAVIKQRQFGYLARFDSLEAAIAAVPLPEDSVFDAVFKDVRAYPGERVRKMARQQLGPSIAYLPLLRSQGLTFTIPPLHVDLAEAMGNPGLRTSTTFDNRQWMDIRGIGGGAAGIEYVERGSHWERNVLVHEYVHLFHGRVLADAENRRIRDLYHAAMEQGRTLDYYASNNESEFFAQAYEAYISPVKAHPLNHKAMNTHEDLRRRDPATYAFVDSMVARQRAYVAGDRQAFRSNWAQVYVNLSERARAGSRGGAAAARRDHAAALLDTALVWDEAYLPAYLSYAALHRDAGRFEEAARWLDRAEEREAGYAPVHAARAELAAALATAGRLAEAAALGEQVAHYRRALELERDLAVRARLNESLRTLYARHGRIPEAIAAAEEYVAAAPTISTYLRDRRDEAAAFAHELRSAVGDAATTIPFFSDLVARKPQHYELRRQFADALAAAGRFPDAVATLEEAQRILQAAGRARADFMVQVAEIRILEGDTAAARQALGPVLAGAARIDPSHARLLRVLASLGERERLARGLAGLADGGAPAERAEAAFTRAWVAERAGETASAELAYRQALESNPYHRRARVQLAGLLARTGRTADAERLVAEGAALPLGPDFVREAATAIKASGR